MIIASIKAEDDIYLFMSGGQVNGFESKEKARKYFNKDNQIGAVGSMLMSVVFDVRIHELSYEDLSPLIDEGVIESDTFREYSLSNDTGAMRGALCTGDNAEEFHESGE